MRLLNTSTFELESFPYWVPEYAILSHTWDDKEILFEDVRRNPATWQSRPGAMKVLRSCARALMDGFQYIWIDTCCIDKSSSAELSESINSMFNWYASANVCYAFLSDAKRGSDLSNCRWFTRGWTLQELVAPRIVQFFDRDWLYMGDRLSLIDELVSITRIDRPMLAHAQISTKPDPVAHLESYSISRRMSWAAGRHTQREEDGAYSLIGLFGVNMPLLYGEGSKAFKRLQEEIVKQSDDQSILAYRQKRLSFDIAQLFSDDPALFLPSIEQNIHAQKSKMYFSGGGLSVQLLLCPCLLKGALVGESIMLGILDCVVDSDYLSRPAILLQQSYKDDKSRYWRLWPTTLYVVGPQLEGRAKSMGNMGFTEITFNPSQARSCRITIVEASREYTYTVDNARSIDAQSVPLRINEIKQPARRCFERDFAYPDQTGSFIFLKKSTDFGTWLDPAMGVLSFHERGSSRFILVWGVVHSARTNTKRPWCKVYPLRDIELDSEGHRDGAEVVQEVIGLFKQKDERMRHLLVPDGIEREASSAVFVSDEAVTVCATIRLLSFLGRHIFDLQVIVNEHV